MLLALDGERDRSGAEALHRECEIGETVVPGERFAQYAQRARVDVRRTHRRSALERNGATAPPHRAKQRGAGRSRPRWPRRSRSGVRGRSSHASRLPSSAAAVRRSPSDPRPLPMLDAVHRRTATRDGRGPSPGSCVRPGRCRKPCGDRGFQMSERLEQHGAFLCGNLVQQLDHPPFVLDGHRVELPLAFRRKTHVVSPSIAGNPAPDDQSFCDELIGETRHVAAGDHQPARQLAHLEPARLAIELRHHVEAWQRRVEAYSQPLSHMALDGGRACQQAQPQSQRRVIVVERRCLSAERLGFEDRIHPVITSPPDTEIACPLIDRDSGKHSHATVAATSSGETRRRWGLRRSSISRASAGERTRGFDDASDRLVDDRRFRVAGTYGIDGDAGSRDFERERARQADDAMLGRAIRGDVRIAGQARRARNVDDPRKRQCDKRP